MPASDSSPRIAGTPGRQADAL